MNKIRIGQGFDVHAFAENRQLILGGVTIPYHLGLLGHSDADVLIHALCDALLGAVALGDIGRHFPDTDERFRGADSRQLLRQVSSMLKALGWSIVNVDITVIAQAPKMAPYIPQMITHLAEDLVLDVEDINIKATTTEQLGFTGRGEGIAAQAICLCQQIG
ncbi:2-C-methyl-D-erythritol 2,4-cyclodiphosphate synthase [Ferrovum sp. PN-J185]|uniref:2-C-methyl-D-erythritol 2,4-cyclodiphosphate synthase n=1 Tax=Ferrovum sp. PN-J185 TaxID=1356306 RepID=UPI000796625C|nr:2-C-methyl-D-erythritol 2,4-cyclodiphosphate synthase [Ferrovum sp. PN-J185]KXW55718.1 2-C-methyl-D-erythritol 2,4-cyclodiphosphate synthase [Ferrovum sp. PN-J185]